MMMLGVLVFSACVAPHSSAHTASAVVVSRSTTWDHYAGGGFAVWIEVTYRVVRPELDIGKTIVKFYAIDAPELKALTVGQIVEVSMD